MMMSANNSQSPILPGAVVTNPLVFLNPFNLLENITFNGAGMSTLALNNSYAANLIQYGGGQLNFGDVGTGVAPNLGIGSIAFQVTNLGSFVFQAALVQVMFMTEDAVQMFGGVFAVSSGGDTTVNTLFLHSTGLNVIDASANYYDLNANKILGLQQPLIPNAVGTLIGDTTTINAILGALRAHGLIAT